MGEKWIEVKDRLPNTSGRYIVFTNTRAITLGNFYTDEKLFRIGKSVSKVLYWMNLPPSPVVPKTPNESICWGCYKADHFKDVDIPCPWATRKQPVEGWFAEKSMVKGYHNNGIESYKVVSCPLYEPNPPKKRKKVIK